MILVVGGRASGKRTYVRSLGYSDEDIADGMLDARPVVANLQDLIACRMGLGRARNAQDADGVEAFAQDELVASLVRKSVVICCEVGNGIVPLDPAERAWRERVGRTVNALADQADSVVRMVCGIPVVLK